MPLHAVLPHHSPVHSRAALAGLQVTTSSSRPLPRQAPLFRLARSPHRPRRGAVSCRTSVAAPVHTAEGGVAEAGGRGGEGREGGKVVVVGAGPAGTLAALYFAQHGCTVDVFEQRALPDPQHRSLDRSYHLAMSHRGMGAVEKVGVDMSRFRLFPYKGSLLRHQSGVVNEVFHCPISAKVLVERMELVRHLVDEAQRLAPGRIRFHWEHPCQEVMLGSSRVVFSGPGDVRVSQPYDLLIGADGVNSQVRKALVGQVGGFRERWFGRMHRIDKFFHRVRPPPGGIPQTHRGELDREATVLRFYYVPSPPPLSVGLFFIHNHADGTYSGGLSFTRKDETPKGSGANLRAPGDYAAVLEPLTMYPQSMREEIAEQLAERPWYTSGSTLQVSRLSVLGMPADGPLKHGTAAADGKPEQPPREKSAPVILVGDAAHAVSAAFGQGVNSALEDCSVLGDLLGRERPVRNLEDLARSYDSVRFPDAHALGVMDHQAEAFAGFRGKWNLSYWTFQLHTLVHGLLHKLLPTLFQDPGLVPMMTIQTSSYSAILARIRRPIRVLAICVAVAAACVALKLLGRL